LPEVAGTVPRGSSRGLHPVATAHGTVPAF